MAGHFPRIARQIRGSRDFFSPRLTWRHEDCVEVKSLRGFVNNYASSLLGNTCSMSQLDDVNTKTEHDLYLTLYASSAGGV
jgi:hypothetical protein